MPHVALILDGNRRWAQRYNCSLFEAYAAGAARLQDVVEASIELRIDTVTAFILSRDNLRRTAGDLSDVNGAIVLAASKLEDYLRSRGIRLSLLGDVTELPVGARDSLAALSVATQGATTGLHLRLAIAYSGRADLIHAARSITRMVARGDLKINAIDEELVSQMLGSSTANDPDILLRTGGCARLSDFLLYNLANTRIIIDDALWPEFSRDRYIRIVRAAFGDLKLTNQTKATTIVTNDDHCGIVNRPTRTAGPAASERMRINE